ncbi:MAG TPA: hypothetical protein VLT58_12265 [Polyangia bacterium]|nr:hypothetical protein [Polyangia bacterium]
MSAPTLAPAPLPPGLPDAFPAEMTATDEPVHGELREIFPRIARRSRPDPVALLPGDYILDEGENPCWLRVEFAKHEATLSVVRTASGLELPVQAGRPVWVRRAADVLALAALGESAGAL